MFGFVILNLLFVFPNLSHLTGMSSKKMVFQSFQKTDQCRECSRVILRGGFLPTLFRYEDALEVEMSGNQGKRQELLAERKYELQFRHSFCSGVHHITHRSTASCQSHVTCYAVVFNALFEGASSMLKVQLTNEDSDGPSCNHKLHKLSPSVCSASHRRCCCCHCFAPFCLLLIDVCVADVEQQHVYSALYFFSSPHVTGRDHSHPVCRPPCLPLERLQQRRAD